MFKKFQLNPNHCH